MQTEWIGTISALAGAAVAGGVAILRDVLGEKRQTRRDEAQRRHEVEEARFASRKDAYITFAAACQRTINNTDDYIDQHEASPGDHGREGPHRNVVEALELVMVIGPKEVADAAIHATNRLDDWAFSNGKRTDVIAAVDGFQAVSRRILKFDLA